MDITPSTAVEQYDEKIQNLRREFDLYFVTHPNANSAKKQEDLDVAVEQLIAQLEELKDVLSKKDYWLMYGKAVDLGSRQFDRCEEALSRCVKLDPKCTEGLTLLGECLWKKGDIPAAKLCFERVLAKERNPTCLRCLSMCLRQNLPEAEKERAESLLRSWNLAKEAVDVSPKDGRSHYVFGNASFALFYASAQRKSSLLEQAKIAYEVALNDPNSCNEPDLHFNRAMLVQLDESYRLTIDGYKRALSLDPFFQEAKDRLAHVMAFLSRCDDSVRRKGKLNQKRLLEYCKDLRKSRETLLGPFGGGQYTNLTTKKSVKLSFAPFDSLQAGLNLNLVVVGKVVAIVLNEDEIPYTFCLLDEDSKCLVVTVYNFVNTFGLVIGHSVAIAEPFVSDVNIVEGNKTFQYRSIRVPTPEVLVVNGKKLGADNVSMTVVGTSSVKQPEEASFSA